MPRSAHDLSARKGGAPVVVRVSAAQRAAWLAPAAEAGETVSDLIRGAVDRELERRQEIAADPLARFDMPLERARR